MKYRILSLLLILAVIVCTGCSGADQPLGSTGEIKSETAAETTSERLAPTVLAISPSGICDTVGQEVRDYLQKAHELYKHGDTSFTVKTTSDLGSKIVPVEFSWQIENEEEYALSAIALEISEDPDFSSYHSLDIGRNSYRNGAYTKAVYNLKTGMEYYWRISMTADDGFKMESEAFSFQTAAGPRLLNIDGVSNARDLGGWDTLDGKTVRQGLVYRSGKLDGATAAGKKTIREVFGIKTELDFRNPYNSADAPMNSPFQNSLNYINITTKSYSLFQQPKTDAKILRIFAKPSNYPIIFHCNAGADRTGAWAFMLKALCGVDEVDLICDYELTNNRFQTGTTEYPFPKLYNALLSQPGKTLQEKAYGFCRDQCGLSDMELANIIAMLTTDSAVFTDPTKGAAVSSDGTVSVVITLRSSENVASVTTGTGEDLTFTFANGKLTLTPNADYKSVIITFTDGSSLPLSW